MKLISNSITHGERIPSQYAFCIPSQTDKVTFGKKHKPPLKMDGYSERYKVLRIIMR